LKKGDEAQKIIDIFVGEQDQHLAAEQKDEVLNGSHAEPPPSTLVGSYKALSSVYTSAEILKVDVFDKFDLDGNFRINRTEVNTVLSSLLSKGKLDDRHVSMQHDASAHFFLTQPVICMHFI